MDNFNIMLMIFGALALFGLLYLVYKEQNSESENTPDEIVDTTTTSDSYDVDSEIYS